MNLFNRFFKKNTSADENPQISYSQSGEDIIVKFIFENLTAVKQPSYLDIGCYHPFNLNNTALFYKNGSKGFNIDANPDTIRLFNLLRQNDVNINLGVSDSSATQLPYYMFQSSFLNTFSEDEYKKRSSELVAKIDVDVKSLKYIIEHYCKGKFPDFLSVDVEGLNLEILKSGISFDSHPKVICVETAIEVSKDMWEKDEQVIQYLKGLDYTLHSDTYINSIFIHRSALKSNWTLKGLSER